MARKPKKRRGSNIFSNDKVILFDALKIFGLYKGKISQSFLEKHKYVKLGVRDVIINEGEVKLVVGFECWYLLDYYKSAIKILKEFDFGYDDMEVYIPKKEYPMFITVNDEYADENGEKIYMAIAPRVKGEKNDEEDPKFLIKEVGK